MPKHDKSGSDYSPADHLAAYEKASKRWATIVERVIRIYDRGPSVRSSSPSAPKWNVLWSNIEVMKPALFSRPPIPVVKRRFGGGGLAGRVATEMWKRALMTEIDDEPWQDVFTRVMLDMLLASRGTCWLSYDPTILSDDDGNDDLVGEATLLEYVAWDDFAHAPFQTWQQVERHGWVARRVWMGREEGKDRFGARFDDVQISMRRKGDAVGKPMDDMGVEAGPVWEIWNAPTRKVCWVSGTNTSKILDEQDDLLGLDNFFPCPKPAYGSVSPGSLFPAPSYTQYEGLAKELQDLTYQIHQLTPEMRAVLAYDKTMAAVARAWSPQNRGRNMQIQVDGIQDRQGDPWLVFPIQNIYRVIEGLTRMRDQVKHSIYEIEGIADISRGAVDPREKLGQSQLKASATSSRLEMRRQELVRIIRDTLKLKAEIQAKHYDPELMGVLGGFNAMPSVQALPPEEQQALFQQVMTSIKDDRVRGIIFDIETGSTSAPDDQLETERMVELTGNVTPLLADLVALAPQAPQAAKVMAEILLMTVRKFRAGAELEGSIEELVDSLSQPEVPPEGDPNAPPADPNMDPNALPPDPNALPPEQVPPEDPLADMRMQAEAHLLQMEQAVGQAEAESRITKAQAEARRAELKLMAEQMRARHQAQKGETDNQKQIVELQSRLVKLESVLADMARQAQQDGTSLEPLIQ